MTVATNGSRNAPLSPPVSDDLSEPRAGTAPGWIHGLPEDSRIALSALAHMLAGTHPEPGPETGMTFARRVLGVPREDGAVTAEAITVGPITRITHGRVLAELIATHTAETAAHDHAPPAWVTEELAPGEPPLRIPYRLSAGFPAGTLHPSVPAVIRFGRNGYETELEVTVRPEHQPVALEIIATIRKRAKALNPYKGRWLGVSMSPAGKLGLTVSEPPATSRESVIASPEIWAELDLNVAAVAGDHHRLQAAGLGNRRGVILCGNPGVGKSAMAAAVARELHEQGFTVAYISSKAGENGLSAAVRAVAELAPAVIVLEDVDLYLGDRRRGGGAIQGLSEMLEGMDASPTERILTIASTNVVTGLDAAAVRNGRFDSIIEVPYPDRPAVEALLATWIDQLPDAEVDIPAVAAMIPAKTSGAELREVVRRAVLGGPVTTVSLGAVIKAGRFRGSPPKHGGGQYL